MNINIKLRKYFCEEIYFYFLIKTEKIFKQMIHLNIIKNVPVFISYKTIINGI